jgi:hypothetical protein
MNTMLTPSSCGAVLRASCEEVQLPKLHNGHNVFAQKIANCTLRNAAEFQILCGSNCQSPRLGVLILDHARLCGQQHERHADGERLHADRRLLLLGQYTAANFNLASDGAGGGALVTDPSPVAPVAPLALLHLIDRPAS